MKVKHPDWPRGLHRTLAAAYTGFSLTLWDKLVAEGNMPKPIRIHGRTIWDRVAVDRAFVLLDGGPLDEDGNEIWEFSNESVATGKPSSKTISADPVLSEEEAARKWQQYKAQQKDDILKKPLGRLERIAISALASQAGTAVTINEIGKGCGFATVQKLVWRGYVKEVDKDRGRKTTFQITEAGVQAAKQVRL